MAVKLYEKDPSKLTAMDEALPNVSASSDISDDEDSNQAADIKEEPVDVTTVDDEPPLVAEATSRAVWGATAFPTPHLRERHSFSSGQEDPSTDSDTVGQPFCRLIKHTATYILADIWNGCYLSCNRY